MKDLEKRLKLLEKRVEKLENSEGVQHKKKRLVKPIEEHFDFEEYKEFVQSVIIEKKGVKPLSSRDVHKRIKLLIGDCIPLNNCGRIMKYLYSDYSFELGGNTYYKLSLKESL